MAGLTARERRTVLLLGALYAAVVIPIGIRKGGDIVYELRLGERFLQGQPLYDTPPPQGAWWPPFATFALVPLVLLAQVSMAAAKGVWAAVGVACLVWTVLQSCRWGWIPVALALAAVSWPLQNNFEHLNANTVLLALIVAAAIDLSEGREGRAGVWIGLATAFKAFPGLLLLYLAYRRAWRGFAASVLCAGVLTYVAMLPYGFVGAVRADWQWLALSAHPKGFSGEPMQKLARLSFALNGEPFLGLLLTAACLAAVALALRYRPAHDDTPYEVGLVSLVAVLVAPVGWFHSFTLAFPAWVAAIAQRPIGPKHRLWTGALGFAGLLTSSLLGHRFYPEEFAFIAWNNDTLGGLLLLTLLVLQRTAAPWLSATGIAPPEAAARAT